MNDGVHFLYINNVESFLQIDTGFWLGWSSFPEVLKIASLEWLYNISMKNFEKKVIFLLVDKYQSFCNLKLLCLMELGRHVQSTQSTSIVMQII